MGRVTGRDAAAVLGLGLMLVAASVHSTPLKPAQLPEAVATTFKTAFPNATIEKLDVEEEEGVMVYDFEFRAGGREKETDIAGDGTMLESTLVIPKKSIPAAAMKGVEPVAKGAKIGRCEWIETSYDLKDGKAIRRDRPMIKYAAEMTKNGQFAEVIVAEDGSVVEAPDWVPIKSKQAPPPGK